MSESPPADVDGEWYTATYPHALAEMRALGLCSAEEHYQRVGRSAGLHPSPFAIPRRRNAAPGTVAETEALFPRALFGTLFPHPPYLYDTTPEHIADAIGPAWLSRRDPHVNYHELAASASGGEPHYLLHSAIDYIIRKDTKRALKILSRLDVSRALSEYHDYMFCMVHTMLRHLGDPTAAARRLHAAHPPRALINVEPVPPIPICAQRHSVYVSMRIHFVSFFSKTVTASVFVCGERIRQVRHWRDEDVARLVDHIGPAGKDCPTTFTASFHIAPGGSFENDFPINTVVVTERTDGTSAQFMTESTLRLLPQARFINESLVEEKRT